MLAGAVANLADRGIDGVVTDYLHTGWWPTFNLADALITCAALAFLADPSNPGAGGMILWPLFGTTNQLTAGLSLLVLTLILWRWGRNYLVALIPLIFIVVMTMSAMVLSIIDFVNQGNLLLQADLFGDWREEVVWRTGDSSALRIYATPHETDLRIAKACSR